jgi:putative FmdB family regulatory protein
MPVYEFTCQNCQKYFEIVRPISEASQSVACPQCGSTDVQRSWSRVVAVTSKKS